MFDANTLACLRGIGDDIANTEARIRRDKTRLRTLRLRVRWIKIEEQLNASLRAELALEQTDTAASIRDAYRDGRIGRVDAVKALRAECDMGLSDGVRYLGE